MDRTFAALAHEARRLVLDALFAQDGQTLGELCSRLTMSRQAASKHLTVLEDAGLVVPRWQGREKLHFLNPVPVQILAERWLRKFEAPQLMAVTALKAALEGPRESSMAQNGFAYQVVIAATPEAVWKALTTAEFSRQYWFGRSVTSDWKVGSPLTVTTPEGKAEAQGQILAVEENRKLSYTWGTGNPETDGTVVLFEIQPMGPVVKLTITHNLDMTTASAPMAVNGWTMILNGLKTLLETGKPLPSVPYRK
jgi:uncharacterized protein YndB with AHSA1/START domain/DNA-binding transcriptional ArsR family regulator